MSSAGLALMHFTPHGICGPVECHESRATGMEQRETNWRLSTAQGNVTARRVLL